MIIILTFFLEQQQQHFISTIEQNILSIFHPKSESEDQNALESNCGNVPLEHCNYRDKLWILWTQMPLAPRNRSLEQTATRSEVKRI